jgi:hypothetical protein
MFNHNDDEEELQLHADEGTQASRKRHRNNDVATKLEAIKWAKENSVNSAAREFNVAPKSIREWKDQEGKLRHLM